MPELREIPVVFTTQAGAYAAGNVVNVIKTIGPVSATVGGIARLRKVVVTDASSAATPANLKLHFFSASTITVAADGAAFAPATADLLKLRAQVDIPTTAYIAYGANQAATVLPALEINMRTVAVKNLFLVVTIHTVKTYGAGTFLNMLLTWQLD